MLIEPDLAKMFKRRQVAFVWNDGFHSHTLILHVPELTSARYSVSGDWGPNYTVCIDPLEPIKLEHRWEKEKTFHTLDCASVEFLSPALKSQRDETPLFLQISDEARKVVYQVLLDSEGEAISVRALGIGQSLESSVTLLK